MENAFGRGKEGIYQRKTLPGKRCAHRITGAKQKAKRAVIVSTIFFLYIKPPENIVSVCLNLLFYMRKSLSRAKKRKYHSFEFIQKCRVC